MNNSKIEDMIDKMLVKNNTSSEYEVSKDAMKSYLMYPCCSVGWYIEGNKLKSCAEGYELTADIITSIKKPLNDFLESINEKKIYKDGSVIVNCICENKKVICEEITPYLKSFATVYYFIGNMMPVKCSFSPGAYGADNWKYKMTRILEFYKIDSKNDKDKRGQNNNWPDWLINHSGLNKNAFIKNNYLMDCFCDDTFEECKFFIDSKYQEAHKYDNRLIFGKEREENIELMKKWIIRNTKIIIQRSYRILNKFDKEWDVEHENEVREICKYIFKKSGIKEKDIEEYVVSLF